MWFSKWWIVWQNETRFEDIYTCSFDFEPGNDEIVAGMSNGFNMVGHPVEAETEEEAITLALEGE